MENSRRTSLTEFEPGSDLHRCVVVSSSSLGLTYIFRVRAWVWPSSMRCSFEFESGSDLHLSSSSLGLTYIFRVRAWVWPTSTRCSFEECVPGRNSCDQGFKNCPLQPLIRQSRTWKFRCPTYVHAYLDSCICTWVCTYVMHTWMRAYVHPYLNEYLEIFSSINLLFSSIRYIHMYICTIIT
jgi:hypothetical protein